MALFSLFGEPQCTGYYLAYTLMGRMDVPSPLCSYVQISVNGEPWGLYLAVEGVEDGFMERNNMTEGELYKPDSMSFGGGRGNGQDFDFEQFRVKDEEESDPDGEAGQKDISESGEEPQEDEAQSSGDFGGFPGQLPEGMSMPEGMFPPRGYVDARGYADSRRHVSPRGNVDAEGNDAS